MNNKQIEPVIVWVVVGVVAVLNVWQTHEILELRKSAHVDSEPQSRTERVVYFRRTGTKYHRDGCRYLKPRGKGPEIPDAEAFRLYNEGILEEAKANEVEAYLKSVMHRGYFGVPLAEARAKGLEPCKVCKP